MGKILIVNASPVICLSKAGLAHLLIAISEKVFIPHPVITEINEGPADDPAQKWLKKEDQILPIKVEAILPDILRWQLGSGESAVIQAGIQRKPELPWLVLDDSRARIAAESFGLQCLGSVGVLIEAKRQNRIGSIRESLSSLVKAGLYIHPKVIEEALRIAAEQ